MALIWLESFDYMAQFPTISDANVNTLLQHRYPIANLAVGSFARSVVGAHGGTALRFGNATQSMGTGPRRDATVEEIGVVGMRIYLGLNQPLDNGSSFLLINSGNHIELRFLMNDNGTVTAHRGPTANALATSPPLFASNMGWIYLEVKFRIHDTLGSFEFKMDGTSVWSETSLDTRDSTDTYWDSITWAMQQMAPFMYLDDVYVLDGSGSVNNDYLGDSIVQTINPSSDGDSSTWTPSSGTNHSALVDDAQAMTDALAETDYVTGDATGEKDLYQYENLASPGLSDATTIHGVQVTNYVYLTEAQPADVKVIAKQNGTEGIVTETIRYDDSAEIFSTQTMFETNPDTALLWTTGQIDLAQFGVEMV